MQETKLYRPNVAGVIVNGEGLILACRRSDRFQSWQLPQGGIDEGEDLRSAFFRELREEIGTDEVDVIGELPEPICYDWPEHLYCRGFHGQRQYYVLARLKAGAQIRLDLHTVPEFDRCEWLPLSEFCRRLDGFKREAYLRAFAELKTLFPDVIRD